MSPTTTKVARGNKAKASKEPTTYVILERHLGDDGAPSRWEVVQARAAVNANVAIRAYAEQFDVEGTFKAVPERSWKGGLTVKPVQKTESLPFED